MTSSRSRGDVIRRYILENVREHPSDVGVSAARRFGISRQAVSKHVLTLVADGLLTSRGNTRNRTHELTTLAQWSKTYELSSQLAEDRVWRDDIAPLLGQVPRNVADIWQYGFTEMFNNAIDHSEGRQITVDLTRTAASVRILVVDDGVGVFEKVQSAFGLPDARHAVLEIAKGKLTTDPARHTGEGIFFTAKVFDAFEILSGGVFFSHERDEIERLMTERERSSSGTAVFMEIGNHSARTTKKVFDRFTSEGEEGFTKTVVPVELARYGDEGLVSRSQARRLMARLDSFKTVLLDFRGVASLGQAFADEVFRVFPAMHPEVDLQEINASLAVERMIGRARSARTGY